jgi:hypothetical protein
MSDKKITDLPVGADADGTEVLPAVQGGVTVGIRPQQLFKAMLNYVSAAILIFQQVGAGAVTRTVLDELRDRVSVKQFGAQGDGVTDDTAAINAALAASKHVIVPAGLTLLVSATVTVPVSTRLEFQGGAGSANGSYPSSYLVKKSTMTTAALALNDRARVDGGGIVCQAGNTGDGLTVQGNGVKVENFLVHGAGGVGVRIGTAGGANVNSFKLENVVAQYNGGHGIYVHDGTTASGANANAGSLKDCFTQFNMGNGLTLGHCFWVTVINHLSEANTGYGIYLSGAANNAYPECRWATFIGGDANEGNTAGQWFDQSYRSTFINPDPSNVPTTAAAALQGSAERTVLGVSNVFGIGATFKGNAGNYPTVFDNGSNGAVTYPVQLKQTTTGGNNQGLGITWNLNDGTTQFNQAGSIRVVQNAVGSWGMVLSGYRAGAPADILILNENALTAAPATDNGISLGIASNRWSQTFTGNVVLSTAAQNMGAGTVCIGGTTATTVGATGAATALPAQPLGYLVAYVGATPVKIPYYNN